LREGRDGADESWVSAAKVFSTSTQGVTYRDGTNCYLSRWTEPDLDLDLDLDLDHDLDHDPRYPTPPPPASDEWSRPVACYPPGVVPA
jgi:hypothetical protein